MVSATGAAAAVIDAATVGPALERTRTAPLVLLDLAVPRDVEPGVEALDGVWLIDIRAIRERLMARGDATADGHRSGARDRGRGGPAVRDPAPLRRARPVDPGRAGRGEAAVRSELARYAGRLSDLTPREREAVEAVARGVAAKLLHDPIVELKERSEPGADGLHAKLLIELLRLDPDAE